MGSLVSQQSQQQNALATLADEVLPADVGQSTAVAVVSPEIRTPYVNFASNKSRHWSEWLSKIGGLSEGDAVFVPADGSVPIRLSPLKCSLLKAHQFWAKYNQDGSVATASMEKQDNSTETVEAAVLVYFPDRVVPARIGFRRAMCVAAHAMNAAMKEAETPEWGTKSAEHAVTLGLKRPCLRFTATITPAPRLSRAGMKYYLGETKISPASSGDIVLLSQFFKQDDANQQIEDVLDRLADRMDEITKLVK